MVVSFDVSKALAVDMASGQRGFGDIYARVSLGERGEVHLYGELHISGIAGREVGQEQ